MQDAGMIVSATETCVIVPSIKPPFPLTILAAIHLSLLGIVPPTKWKAKVRAKITHTTLI